MDEDAKIIAAMTLFGGHQVGFNTNSETKTKPCFIEIKGEKIVCVAQGGECRYNHKYYTPGMRDTKSWTTPIIDEDCPNRCGYKMIVCDDHEEGCKDNIEYYHQYNKFRGLFRKYCRNFDKFGIKDGMRADGKNKERKDRKDPETDEYMRFYRRYGR